MSKLFVLEGTLYILDKRRMYRLEDLQQTRGIGDNGKFFRHLVPSGFINLLIKGIGNDDDANKLLSIAQERSELSIAIHDDGNGQVAVISANLSEFEREFIELVRKYAIRKDVCKLYDLY